MSEPGREWRRTGWYDNPLFLAVSRIAMIFGAGLASICVWVFLSQSAFTDKRFDVLTHKIDEMIKTQEQMRIDLTRLQDRLGVHNEVP